MEESEGDVLCVRARGTLTSGDYRQVLAPQLESLVQRFGSVRVLFLMDEPFQGWDRGGAAALHARAPWRRPVRGRLTVWITAASLTVGTIAGLAFLGRRRHGATKSMLYGVATGATSGLIAVLTIAVLTAAAGGVSGVFTTWWTYLLILAVPARFLLLQNAMQARRLVASQPGITLANPLVAAVWGVGPSVRTCAPDTG